MTDIASKAQRGVLYISAPTNFRVIPKNTVHYKCIISNYCSMANNRISNIYISIQFCCVGYCVHNYTPRVHICVCEPLLKG